MTSERPLQVVHASICRLQQYGAALLALQDFLEADEAPSVAHASAHSGAEQASAELQHVNQPSTGRSGPGKNTRRPLARVAGRKSVLAGDQSGFVV